MERTMSVEEKIRKAEEIYYRRKNQEIPSREPIQQIKQNKKDIKLFKKMVKQIIICLVIYSVCYLIINNNYVFSEDFTQKVREILSRDINFSQIYSIFLEKINTSEQEKEITAENDEIQNNDENIGGAEEILTIEEQIVENNETIANELETDSIEEIVELSQMEQDANYIKSTTSFVKPVEGKISSRFGLRNPTTPTVPKNHTGTDIAAITGTKIISATEGTVIYTSSEGDYGNHLKIQINDVIILYAHCNQIYVSQGDVIKQGQEIAEVGSTGNTTGPHLHFEIRYQERYVDPQLVLEL